MRVRVKVHGLLTAAVGDPGGWIGVTLPGGTDAEGLINALSEQMSSPLFDPRSCMATIGGVQVRQDRILRAGEDVELYHLFSGG